MTNEDLLQQSKDQVATSNGFKNWSELKDYCDELTGSGQLLNYHEEAFELAIQRAREEANTKWIPVSERIPEYRKKVIGHTPHTSLDGDRVQAVYCSSTGIWRSCVSGQTVFVSHWQELPEPPKN